jgi:hypothetical protein
MKKIFTIIAVTASLIGGANFAFDRAANAATSFHTDKNDGCTYQGYPCSEWQHETPEW